MVEPELLELMSDRVVIEPATGDTDEFGKQIYGPPRTVYIPFLGGRLTEIPARIEGRMKQVTTPSGQEVVSSIQVYLCDALGCTTNDRLTLPARYQKRQPDIEAVEIETDQNGPYYECLYS